MSAHDACVRPEPGTSWRRSSRSVGMNNCVETARCGEGAVAVRDSKNPRLPYLVFSPGAWTGFVHGLGTPPR
ncbi:DUF397 domain-containing protein [Streptomyces tirandamycinicus]|uniref:DUF397 domain-containing protein n=1 Tax=Streptomyces tirandamycinicus TaxID=2174846 RepID=A0A2S1SRY6_9ACTN|nr:DUF397 domain-containing protein [Streptomyces tirandamycinicus]AWI29162.1 DUF397 domain-containing protein [Streptomyces tirandamycinicus]